MNLENLIKLGGLIIAAFAAWIGYKKYRHDRKVQIVSLKPRGAQPFVGIKYIWSGDDVSPNDRPLEIRIGNREKGPIVVEQIAWFVPAFRLRWDVEPDGIGVNLRIEEGDGAVLKLDISDPLRTVNESRYFQGITSRLTMVSDIRLAIWLKTGEVLIHRVPNKLRFWLAKKHRFSTIEQWVVRLHGYICP